MWYDVDKSYSTCNQTNKIFVHPRISLTQKTHALQRERMPASHISENGGKLRTYEEYKQYVHGLQSTLVTQLFWSSLHEGHGYCLSQ